MRLRPGLLLIWILLGPAFSLTLLFPAEAQQAGHPPRVGFMAMGQHPAFQVFRQALRDLGYVEDRNIVLEPRFAEAGRVDQFDALAVDLVKTRVDVIVALINPEIAAASRATETIPIVMVVSIDPVGRGFVRSLARPQRNVTGLTWDPNPEISGKMVELLNELLPRLERIGGLVDRSFPGISPYWSAAQHVAERRGLQLRRVELQSPSDFGPAFKSMKQDQVGAVQVFGGSMLFGSRAEIARLSIQAGLPVMFPYREAVEAGGLISYGPSLAELWRRSATYVDRILKGAKPAELPVEQPTKFELAVNLKTAKALGLTIPPSLLLRADTVIE